MAIKLNTMHPKSRFGVLFTVVLLIIGCNGNNESVHSDNVISNDEKVFLKPTDSLVFNYSSNSWKDFGIDYSENRYGQTLILDSNNIFSYLSIDSDNQLHKFDFSTNEHTYSPKICTNTIEAYKLDSSLMYLLYDNVLFIKDYHLNTIDSFEYRTPVISKKHGIDFTVENSSNLFKIKDYFVLMYFMVDEMPDGTSLYRNSERLFYFFNRDTAYFAGEGCKKEQDTTFQYFRYPVVTNDMNYIYHTPRVMNCISKTNEISTVVNSKIDTVRNNYLSIKHSDQYEISKLKKYRFSTDYNREIIVSGDWVYLIREIPDKIYYENGVRTYKNILELKKFDKQLNLIKSFYIENKIYSFAYIDRGKLFLFDINKNKAMIYEI